MRTPCSTAASPAGTPRWRPPRRLGNRMRGSAGMCMTGWSSGWTRRVTTGVRTPWMGTGIFGSRKTGDHIYKEQEQIMSINRVSIAGYLTRDAELRTVNGNLAVLGFTVAVNEKRKDRGSGQYVDAPVFVRCAVFGQRAEHLARYMTKGTKVMIDGRLHYSSYMKDEEQRSSLSVIVDQLEFGNVKPREENAMSQEQTAAPASPATTDSDFYDEDVWEQTGLC
ncbi:hypothetical protein B5G37_14370 [Pseudoflavonifractor sp. An85]|nr:hypothetical protein B5G37_14370 [Pseudoflavonifractor sp. An85]